MTHTIATVLTALGVATIVLGLIGLIRPRMYESMMRRSAAKGPIPRLPLIAVIELVVGAILVTVAIVTFPAG